MNRPKAPKCLILWTVFVELKLVSIYLRSTKYEMRCKGCDKFNVIYFLMSMSKQDIINKWKPVWVLHCEKCNSNKVAKSSINNSHLKALPKTFCMIIKFFFKNNNKKKTLLKWLCRVCDVKYIRLKRRNKPLILVLNLWESRLGCLQKHNIA